MDPRSVITLGQLANVPLIRPSSELSYRLEPHGYKLSGDVAGVDMLGVLGGEGCTRGGASWVVLGGCYTGYPADARFDAYLMNIQDILVHTAV